MRIFSVLLALATISSYLFADNAPPPRSITATLKSSEIKIDGIMEPAWYAGGLADNFVQKQPTEGEPGSQITKCYIMYDPDALYVLFNCLDAHPDSIMGRIQRRDNDSRSDFIDFFLDTFHDHRNAYWWTVTAAGVQAEGTMINENNIDAAWDAVWESAAGRSDSGWVAEFKIPFNSIRHGGARADGWGIQFARRIERRREYSAWMPVSRERDLRVGEFGNLMGLDKIGSSRHVEILPHAVGRFDALAGEKWKSKNEWENLGITVKIVPSNQWTIDAAYQPDFAQVDVDNEVINVSDYPIYLSEKRPFFLDVTSLFDSNPISLFYTRRIADPDYIGRVSGQWNALRGTVLAAKNRNEYGDAESNFVGRTIFNIGERNTLGVTGTYLEREKDNFHAASGGIDGRIRWGNWDGARYMFAAVDRTDSVGHHVEPFETRLGANVDLGFLKADAVTRYRGKDYNINDLGYGDYSNVWESFMWMGDNWQSNGKHLESYGLDINGGYKMFPNRSHKQGSLSFDLFFNTKNSWNYGFGAEYGNNFRRRYNGAEEPYDRDNYGDFYLQFYHYHNFFAWVNSDSRKWIEYGINNIGGGKFRDGHKFDFSPYATLKPRSNLDFTPSMDMTRIWNYDDLDNKDTTYRIWRLRSRWSPTLNLSFRGTIQYIEDEKLLLSNFLLAYNWHPGSWFYIVYDETRDTKFFAYKNPGDRTLRLKFTYFVSAG